MLNDFLITFSFFFVHGPHPDLIALRFDYAYPTQRIAVLFLTSKAFVNKRSDFLALGFLAVVWVICRLGMASAIYYGVETIAASRVYLNFCLSSHLPESWYMFFMLFKYFCSKEAMLRTKLSVPIVFMGYLRHSNCNTPLRASHCCSNVSMERI